MRKIEALDDFEHVLLRPQMYVGSINPIDDKIIIFDKEKNRLQTQVKKFTEGFYRIFDEVLDNALDEGKRCFEEGRPFPFVKVSVDSKLNQIEITDSGQGFVNGTEINPKTGISNIETALTKLRAGSNFHNSEFDVSIIGMNGVGVSATNMLSDEFEIETQNSQYNYIQKWNKFVSDTPIKSKPKNKQTYTKIRFIPRKDSFKNIKWDFDLLFTKMILRNFLMKNDDTFKKTELIFEWDGERIEVNKSIVPDGAIQIPINKNSICFIWKSDDKNDSRISFVNGSQCTGFHQTYFEEFINKQIFDFDSANDHYRSLIILNLKPKYVQFKEQNKTRFDTNRFQMEDLVPLKITKLKSDEIKKLPVIQEILELIEEYKQNVLLKKIKSKQKKTKSSIVISDKFFPAKETKNLFICEGLSALGSINQKRNPKTDATYALRGKIKNTQRLSDLSESAVIIDLINILGLDITDKGQTCKYDKVIIACDADTDGAHITGLIINFFHKWFPKIILNEKLFGLNVPLLSYEENNKRKYIYNLNEFKTDTNYKNIRYLKGLGSLDLKDWELIFKDMNLQRIINDGTTDRFLQIAFGNEANLRKKWLSK